MSNKNILDGFVPRRAGTSGGRSSNYQAPLTGVPKELSKTRPAEKLTRKERRKLAKNSSSDSSWESTALKNSVLTGANPSDPLNQDSPDLSEGGGKRRRGKKAGRPVGPRTKGQKIRRVLKFSLIPILLFGGYYVFNLLNLSGKVFDGNPLGFLKSTELRGEKSGRVNIL
ncbi:MAG: hypothetical protein QG623_1, partial [Patescibacteria group bacterium]|nr:hypothetical protein [Patescibacteria group bacterium]